MGGASKGDYDKALKRKSHVYHIYLTTSLNLEELDPSSFIFSSIPRPIRCFTPEQVTQFWGATKLQDQIEVSHSSPATSLAVF